MRNRNRGTGPGPITLDGCSVELYKLLPHFDEAEIVHSALPSGGTVLELGAGAGRVTKPLAALGHRITAVDFSREMLEQIHEAETILADIAGLRLNRTFDGVVLGSTLINVTDDRLRHEFLETCAHHVAPQGRVLIECHAKALLDRAAVGLLSERDGIRISWAEVHRDGDLVAGTLQYECGDRVWTQTFATRFLNEAQISRHLEAAGLRFDRWLNASRTWFSARREAPGYADVQGSSGE